MTHVYDIVYICICKLEPMVTAALTLGTRRLIDESDSPSTQREPFATMVLLNGVYKVVASREFLKIHRGSSVGCVNSIFAFSS